MRIVRYVRNLATRYHPRYVRALVYMMQESDYRIYDYLRWYQRTRDFGRVEKRKRLVLDLKARLLMTCAYVLWALALAVVCAGAAIPDGAHRAVAVLLFLDIPFVLPYLMAPAIWIFDLAGRPAERMAIVRATRALHAHKGVKIAIVGTSGMSSMREILVSILSTRMRTAAPVSGKAAPRRIADFALALRGDEDALIFELGTRKPGDISALCGMIRPDWGIIAGVDEAHLERFGTMHRLLGALFELAACLGHKPLYINGEAAQARSRAPHASVVYDKNAGAGDWRIVSASSDLSGLSLAFEHHGRHYSAHTPLLGAHQAGPIAAAADIASRLGVSDEHIMEGIGAIRGLDHHMMPHAVGEMTLIDDTHGDSPDDSMAAIEFLEGISGRRWYVTPGLTETGESARDVHREIGRRLAAANVECVGLIKDPVTPLIAKSLADERFSGEIRWFDSMPAAIEELPHAALPGDIVLIQNYWPDEYA